MEGFYFSVAIGWLLKFIAGNTLLFFTISPFAYIAEKSKGLVVPMIVSAIVVMGSAALSNQELGALYPWTATYFLMQGRIQSTGYPMPLSVGIIVFVSVIGFLVTFQYFKKEDLK
jgi:bacitracin transport system permease protein